MLHIDQIFKCEHSSSNFDFVVSFQYREIYVLAFTIPFEWDISNFSHSCHLHAILMLFTCHANGYMSSKSLNVMQTD